MENKEIIKNLKSKDSKIILDTLKYITEKGNKDLLYHVMGLLHKDQEIHLLAANLRRAFSGIVAGNVKEEGIGAIEQYGKFKIQGDNEILHPLDELLSAFVEQKRMKLPGEEYIPCYEIIQ